MTEEKIIEKSLEAYPIKREEILTPAFGPVTGGDVNRKYREGYEQCLRDVNCLPKINGWVARDKNGELNLFEVKPRRDENFGYWWDRDYQSSPIDENAFPELTWENEPKEVELLIREI